jgi:hypothetical protein
MMPNTMSRPSHSASPECSQWLAVAASIQPHVILESFTIPVILPTPQNLDKAVQRCHDPLLPALRREAPSHYQGELIIQGPQRLVLVCILDRPADVIAEPPAMHEALILQIPKPNRLALILGQSQAQVVCYPSCHHEHGPAQNTASGGCNIHKFVHDWDLIVAKTSDTVSTRECRSCSLMTCFPILRA